MQLNCKLLRITCTHFVQCSIFWVAVAKCAILIEYMVVSWVPWWGHRLCGQCPCSTVYGCKIVSSFKCSGLQEWPQWIICLQSNSFLCTLFSHTNVLHVLFQYLYPTDTKKSIALAFSIFQFHHECLVVSMTCPDIHKFNLTCWTFEFEITPAHGTKLALAIGLCSTHPLCFRPDVGHRKYMAEGKVQAYTRLWDGKYSLYFICEDNML